MNAIVEEYHDKDLKGCIVHTLNEKENSINMKWKKCVKGQNI